MKERQTHVQVSQRPAREVQWDHDPLKTMSKLFSLRVRASAFMVTVDLGCKEWLMGSLNLTVLSYGKTTAFLFAQPSTCVRSLTSRLCCKF